MEQSRHDYLPAAGTDFLLPLYDSFVKLIGVERARRTLFEQAAVQPDHRVLDIGCGTGTFAIALRRWRPRADIVGLDPDPKALARARLKADRAGVLVQLDRGYGDDLPYPDHSFDRVFSSLMFHHLPHEVKTPVLAQARRVLKPSGSLHLLDFAGTGRETRNPFERWFHSNELMRDNTPDRIVGRMHAAGFAHVRVVQTSRLLFGNIVFVEARA